ncbi:MAG: phage tail tape measure protein [Xanthomonadaceae bacterium]|nr:phage tail tape measure protein [Xanthomonadaceae bacterium]
MATRSLGTLTLDLIAKIGGFESGMDKAARTAKTKGREITKAAQESAKATEQAWSKVGEVVGTVLAGITVGAVFQKFIGETRQAEQEQAQLAAVVKSTGEAAGFSVAKLNDMAEAMAKASTFGAGDINQAQARLLSYTGVVGEQFPKAMQAAVDMAVRLGMAVPQAAEAVGKALDSPKDGLSALSKQGFRFTEDQKALVEELQATGRTAEAQGIILAALESSYGGAAQAARDTFGGALSALQETINDLLTGDSGSMAKLKSSVEAMNSTLASEDTRTAFQTLISWMTDLSTASIQGAANLIAFINAKDKLGAITGTDEFGKMTANAEAASHKLSQLTAQAERYQEAISRGSNVDGNTRNLERTRKLIDDARIKANQASEALKNFANAKDPLQAPKASEAKAVVPDATGAAARAEAAKKAARDKEAADKKAIADAKRIFEQGESYIQQLNDQVAKVEELSTVEKILFDLQLGKVTLTHAQKDEAFRLGQQIDDTKKLNEQKQADLNLVMAGVAAQRELNDQVDQYNRAIAGLGLGNRARDKDAGRNQIDDKYSADRRRLDDARREAMNNGKFDGAAQKRYDDELTLIENFKSKAIVSYEDYWARLTAGEANWKNGASEALNNYLDQSRNVAAQTADMWSRGFSSAEDALAKFTTGGKVRVSELANSIIADFIRIQSRAAMSSVLSNLFGAWTGSATGVGNAGYGDYSSAGLASAFGYARGGYTGPGGKYEYAGPAHKGEVYFSQEDVARHGGVGAVEALRKGNPRDTGWAEGGAVGPYTALPQGRGGQDRFIVNNYGPAANVETQEKRNGNGGMDFIVTIKKVIKDEIKGELANEVATGRGGISQALTGRYPVLSGR